MSAAIAVAEPGPTGGVGSMGATILVEALRRAMHDVTRVRLSRRPASTAPVLFGGGNDVDDPAGLEVDGLFVSTLYVRQWMHIPWLLERMGMRALAGERAASDPLVALGGQSMLAPRPIEPFADVLALGDGELTGLWLANRLAEGRTKAAILDEAAETPGFYVPGRSATLTRWQLPDFEPIAIRGQRQQVVIEAARGCASKCAFCPIGWAGGQYREGAIETIDRLVRRSAGRSVNLFAPDYSSVSWHDQADAIVEDVGCRPLGRDARLDVTAREVRAGRAAVKSYNFGVEGVSERTRAAIGKPLRHGQLVDAMAALADAGIRDVKWYLICAFPGEDQGDFDEFATLLDDVRARYDGKLDLTLTHLQPVPQTPLQHASGAYSHAAREAMEAIRSRLRDAHDTDGRRWIASQPKGEHLHHHDTALQRAGLDATPYLIAAGGRESMVSNGRWIDVADAAGWDWRACLAPIGEHDPTHWDHVAAGASRRQLWRAWQRFGERMESAS